MYIDVKVEVWQRIFLSDDADFKEIIELLEVHTPSELWNVGKYDPSFETLLDTEEYISPEENGGQSTIEIYNNDGQLVWDNSIKQEL
jgi:hypothetical protein